MLTLHRSALFMTLTRRISTLKTLLPALKSIHNDDKSAILASNDTTADLTPYTIDWLNKYGFIPDTEEDGVLSLVVRPANVNSLAATLKLFNDENIKVIPQGGNTSVAGGSVPLNKTTNEVIISTNRMNKILKFDSRNHSIELEAGVVLENVQNFCESKGFLFPLDIGSKGSCQIGGLIATNAGGSYFKRFGSISNNLLSMNCVLPSGECIRLGPLRDDIAKDNVGYSTGMRNMFIGSEGTLGIITSASFKLTKLPTSRQCALVSCSSFADIERVLLSCSEIVGRDLSAVEWIHRSAMKLLERKGLTNKNVDETINSITNEDTESYILVESRGYDKDRDYLAMVRLTMNVFVLNIDRLVTPTQLLRHAFIY